MQNMDDVHLNIKVSNHLRRLLKIAAVEKGISVKDLITELVKEYLNKAKNS